MKRIMEELNFLLRQQINYINDEESIALSLGVAKVTGKAGCFIYTGNKSHYWIFLSLDAILETILRIEC